MFKLYRPLNKGEFIVVGGDTAQGGIDANYTQFMSKTQSDIPLVMKKQGVAADATVHIRDALRWVYQQTGVKPVVALERQNGGSSEMKRLYDSSEGSYTVYYGYRENGERKTDPGWDTNQASRALMLGDWLRAFNNGLIRIYDEDTIEQHQTFTVNKRGKPEAEPNTHDDAVMSCAIAYQVFLTENPPPVFQDTRRNAGQRLKLHTS